MKILVLHNQLWTQYKSVIFQGIFDEFKDTTHEILVLQTAICEKSRLNIIDFDLTNFNYSYPYVLLNKTSLEESNAIKTTILWLKYILNYKPDVINLTGYSDLGTIFVLILAKILGIKTLMTNESIYSTRLHTKSINQVFVNLYKSMLLKLTDGFLSYGIKSNDYLFRYGSNKSQIFSFLNAFDRSKFRVLTTISESNSEPYILFVGRLSEEKNLDSLIDLARLFKRDKFNCRIKIVGDGDEYLKILNLIQLENLPIDLEGAINWDQLGSIYKSAVSFILPSLNETWGMVANEALEMGIPVICSNVCGCADDLVINDFNGLVINDLDFNNPQSINYSKIKEYLNSLINNNSNELLNTRISSIYDENRLIKEFISAFKRCAI